MLSARYILVIRRPLLAGFSSVWCQAALDDNSSRQQTHQSSTPSKHANEQAHQTSTPSNLVSGKVRPDDLPTFVVAECGECLWTVYGNRRLHALKEFDRPCRLQGWRPQIQLIVHTSPLGVRWMRASVRVDVVVVGAASRYCRCKTYM